MEFWQPYLIAVMIGLLVGLEREKSRHIEDSMGIRTFLLISVLGALVGGSFVPMWLSVIVTLFALALVVVSYYNQTRISTNKSDLGLTTEFAAGVVFCLGVLAHQEPALSAVAGPIVAVILYSKSRLHQFIKVLRPVEIETALLLFLTAVVVLNLVPDTTVDPWKVLNPRKFGYLILALACVEFFGYVLTQFIGSKKGALVSGVLGGLVSSTAVMLSSARQSAKTQQGWRTQITTAFGATLSSLAQLVLIVALVSQPLISDLLVPMAATLLVGTGILYFLARNNTADDSQLNIRSPLDWKGVFRLGIALGAILALITLVKNQMGEQASMAASFVTALFELHGVSLANATMFSQNQISMKAAGLNIGLAVVASFLAKIIMAWTVGHRAFARRISVLISILIVVYLVTAFFSISN